MVDMIQRYLFTLTDNPRMHDYLHYRDRLTAAGTDITSIDEVIDAFKETIRERRPMMKLRSDFMSQHLHQNKNAIFGHRGEKLNAAVKNLTMKYQV